MELDKKEKEPTVFLVQENPYVNVLSAEEYGKIEVLFESGQQIMFSPQPAIKKLRRKLRNFDDNDHLLMMGDPAAMGGPPAANGAPAPDQESQVSPADQRRGEF